MSKEILVTASGIQENGNTVTAVGITMILLAGLKIWIFGMGIWSILIVACGVYFFFVGNSYAKKGYDAELEAVRGTKS